VKVPSIAEAHAILEEGLRMNLGPWGDHCRTAGSTARAIASAARGMDLDPEEAYVLGLLHDIGRRQSAIGIPDVRHVLDGYAHLTALGYEDAARICLTHSFPIKKAEAFASPWGELHAEKEWVQDYLDRIEYTAYDRLIQLCDSLALPHGPVLIEKRLVDVALRNGVNALTVEKWRAFLAVKDEFDIAVGGSIYDVLPDVVGNTFMSSSRSSSG
jgi:hypothetical protein